MGPPNNTKIFISYARKDGADLARRLQQSLEDEGFDAWLDKQRLLGGAKWIDQIAGQIDSREVLLVLMTPGSYASEVCRLELVRAWRKGKRLIPLLAEPSETPFPLEGTQYINFTSSASYDGSFLELLAAIKGGATAVLEEKYRQTRLTYVTAPPTVANYIQRPEALRALRDALFADVADGQHQPIALTALAGMGGIGKTVLAKALTQDEVVQQAFPDGIVWVTIGKESNYDPVSIVSMFHRVGRALGEDWERHKDPMACEDEYRTAMAKKAALVVVDDVWKKSDLDPFLAESKRSRLLFTTRDAAIGRFVGAREHTAQLLGREQARTLLAAWADLQGRPLPGEADAIIDECGSLPLALSQIGAVLRDAGPELWKDTLDLLRKANLKGLAEQLPPGQESFFRAVEVSFKALAPVMQERYKALAVLLEDMAAPLPILETLWGVNDAEVRRISRNFVDRSLAQREAQPDGTQADGDADSIRLHDLQLDYVRAQYPDREALDLIHGAVRLSSHVIARDPNQFGSQVVARLLPYAQPEGLVPGAQQFATSIVKSAPRPWLRSLQPALSPPGTALVRILVGHSREVTGVAVSADGRLAVSASVDRTLKVWDLESGRELRTLEGHSAALTGVAVSADGRRAVSASYDRTLKVWDLESGRELRTLEGHSWSVNGVALSRDGRRAVSASYDQTLKVWEMETGRELHTLKGHLNGVNGVALSGDGRRAVSASEDCTLKVWDLETGCEVRTLEGHSTKIKGVALSGDGRRAVSASFKALKVWDLESGRDLRTLADPSWVNGVALSGDGRRAVSASLEALKVWDLESGRELRVLGGHSDMFLGVAMRDDGRRAVSASFDKTLKVWDVESGRELRAPSGHSDRVHCVAVSADGRRAVSASYDEMLKVWDLASCRELCTLKGHARHVEGVAVSVDGRRAVSASYDRTLKVWDLEGGRELRTLYGHDAPVNAVALTVDGRRAVSASNDDTLKIWNLESGDELGTLEGHSSAVSSVALTVDGRRAVSASLDETLKVWDLESCREVRTLSGHSRSVNDVVVSADGRRAVSASDDETLKVWDLESGCQLRTLEGHSDLVYGVAVSGVWRWAVSASWDKTVKLWDLDAGTLVTTFTCDASAWCCAFAGDRKIVAGDNSGGVHFLQLEL